MTELQTLIEGFQILSEQGATGIIAGHDEVTVIGAKYDIAHPIRDKLYNLGFYSQDHKWSKVV